jgi:branched-chain amino acid transport system substrate-binding protein
MKRGKRLLIAFVVSLSAFLVTLPAFAQGTGPSPAGATPIKIGGSLSLTGTFSETSKWVKAGYEFWEMDINRRGGLLGRPVKMIVYDDESNVDKSVTYYERAISVDKVDLVFGGPPGTIGVALMPLVEKHEKVFIGPGGQLKVFDQGFTFSFASPPLMAEWAYISFANPLDDLIPKTEWPKSVALFTMNNAIGVSARGNVIKAFEERGIKVVVDETYNVPLSDATAMVSKAKAKGAEIFCCLSNFDDGVMLVRSAKSMNYRPKLIMQQIASKVPAWMKELGEDGNNVLGNTCWSPGLPYPGNQKIMEGAKEKLGMPVPPDYFGQAYCWMHTLELGVRGAGTLDNRKIRDYLRSHAFDLPYGKGVKFDSRGLPPPYAFTVQTTGGQNKLVWPREVAGAKLVYPRPPWSK